MLANRRNLRYWMRRAIVFRFAILTAAICVFAAAPEETRSAYILGPDDQITIWALGAEELSEKPVRVDTSGYIDLPMLGRLKAAGLTVEQLKIQLIAGLKTYVQEPRVSVTITEFRSQPVSVFGAVTTPGVHQLQGRKTLVEVLSLAGGLRPDAGQTVIITRQKEFGRIPARNVREAVSGKYSVAKINLKSVMEATNPEENLLIQPNDVISVPRAQMVYVIGQVKKAGAFVLNERESVSVLQALSMAEGLDRTASGKSARILRKSTDVAPADVNDTEQVQLDAKKPEQLAQDLQKAQQIPVDLNKILDGTALDVPMRPNDILFVPNSAAKNAGLKAIETAIQLGTGVVIWRR